MVMCPALTVLADMVGSVGGLGSIELVAGVPSSFTSGRLKTP